MNEPDITEPLEPVEPNAAEPTEPTPPQDSMGEVISAEIPSNPGIIVEASPLHADLEVSSQSGEGAPEEPVSSTAPTENVSALELSAWSALYDTEDREGHFPEMPVEDVPAEINATDESSVNAETPELSETIAIPEAPISMALPDMMDAEGIFADEPIAAVPPGIVATDESPSEQMPAEDATSIEESQAVALPDEALVEPTAVVAEPPTEAIPTPPPAPPRPPVPPVFFVWHPILNEEREDTEVLPSERLREAYHLLEVTGALHWREVKTHTPDVNLGKPEALTAYHSKAYCQSIVALSEGRASLWAHDQNLYLPTLTHTASTAGLSVAAARSAIKVALNHPKARVFTLAGLQPNACRDHLEDGHLYNDVLMALADAQNARVKTAFINLDAAHPRHIQERFFTEPLLTISLHEHPSFLYPYTGTARETGKGAGAGHNINIPMPPGVSDAGYQLVLDKMVLPLLHRFQPDLLVVLGGITAHMSDPASHLQLTSKGYQNLIATLMDAVPRLVLFGGDATHYATAARLWAIALATMAERTNSLPPQIPAAHARLWSGGTFHDTELPPRSAPYQEYTYALLAHELEQSYGLLRDHWELPELSLPAQLSDQRERIQVRPSGDIVSFTSKEPSLGMTFAGLSQSLGDDDDDEVASRRTPRPVSRSRTKWDVDTEDEEELTEKNKPRGRRDDTPPANPLGGGDRRAGFDSRPTREGGRGTRDTERPPRESERRVPDGGRGMPNEERDIRGGERRPPDTRRGVPNEDRGTRGGERRPQDGGGRTTANDERGARSGERRTQEAGRNTPRGEERSASAPPREQGQRRADAENRSRSDKGRDGRGEPRTGERRDGRPLRPHEGEPRDSSRQPRTPHSAMLSRTSPALDKSTDEHSPTPSRSTPRSTERNDIQRPESSFRRRERGGRGKGDGTPPAPPPADGNPETPDSRPARRHRPRPRR